MFHKRIVATFATTAVLMTTGTVGALASEDSGQSPAPVPTASVTSSPTPTETTKPSNSTPTPKPTASQVQQTVQKSVQPKPTSQTRRSAFRAEDNKLPFYNPTTVNQGDGIVVGVAISGTPGSTVEFDQASTQVPANWPQANNFYVDEYGAIRLKDGISVSPDATPGTGTYGLLVHYPDGSTGNTTFQLTVKEVKKPVPNVAPVYPEHVTFTPGVDKYILKPLSEGTPGTTAFVSWSNVGVGLPFLVADGDSLTFKAASTQTDQWDADKVIPLTTKPGKSQYHILFMYPNGELGGQDVTITIPEATDPEYPDEVTLKQGDPFTITPTKPGGLGETLEMGLQETPDGWPSADNITFGDDFSASSTVDTKKMEPGTGTYTFVVHRPYGTTTAKTVRVTLLKVDVPVPPTTEPEPTETPTMAPSPTPSETSPAFTSSSTPSVMSAAGTGQSQSTSNQSSRNVPQKAETSGSLPYTGAAITGTALVVLSLIGMGFLVLGSNAFRNRKAAK